MGPLFSLLAALLGLVAFICWLSIWVDALEKAIWKGVVFFIFPLYALYYAVFEFKRENKWAIVILAFGGGAIAGEIWSRTH
jgi:hypothetical protein